MIIRRIRQTRRSIVVASRVFALVLCTQCRGGTEPALGADEIRGQWAEQDWRGDAVANLVQTGSGDMLVFSEAAQRTAPGTTRPRAGDQLVITEYEAGTGTIKGTFQFEASSSDEHRQYGESARFENGRFSANVVVFQR